MLCIPTTALSVRQPWAWAIVSGGKDIENRSLAAVKHGLGPRSIAVHASKGMTRDEYEDAADFMKSIGVDCPYPDQLIRGAVIGTAVVTDVVKEHASPWFFGPRGLVLTGQTAVDEPIPASGALGYFSWKQGGEIETPKPWMMAWGRQSPAAPQPVQPAPLPLFETSN